jgi:outer membrane protein
MKHTKRLSLSFLIFWLPFSQAEDLIEIYNLALRNDPQLQAAKQQIRSVRESKSLAWSRLLPAIDLSGSYSLVHGSTTTTNMAGKTDQTSDTYRERGLELNLTHPI